eukprot:776321-Rhodomonas_salina.1
MDESQASTSYYTADTSFRGSAYLSSFTKSELAPSFKGTGSAPGVHDGRGGKGALDSFKNVNNLNSFKSRQRLSISGGYDGHGSRWQGRVDHLDVVKESEAGSSHPSKAEQSPVSSPWRARMLEGGEDPVYSRGAGRGGRGGRDRG